MSFICPYPLAYGGETDYEILWAYEEGNCAVRCPTVTFTENEWRQMEQIAGFIYLFANRKFPYISSPGIHSEAEIYVLLQTHVLAWLFRDISRYGLIP